MAYKKRSERRSYGGMTGKVNEYNAKGSPEMREEGEKSHGFRKGGKIEGEKAKHHMAKRARGGGVRGMSGGAPFSSGRHTSAPSNKMGSPGEQAPIEP